MPGNLQLLIKPASSLCDLRCRYCFYHDLAQHQSNAPKIMTEATMERLLQLVSSYFDQPQIAAAPVAAPAAAAPAAAVESAATKLQTARQTAQQVARPLTLQILFQGGEPTLAGFDYFKKFLELEQQLLGSRNIITSHSIQTNACNLSSELIELLIQHDFLFGVSLDGPEHIHDAMRVHRSGQGSFHEVMVGIDRLRQHHANFNILTVLTDLNALNIDEVYRFFREQHFYQQQYIACLDPLTDDDIMAVPYDKPQPAIPARSLRPSRRNAAANDACHQTSGFLSEKAYEHFLMRSCDLWYSDLLKGEYFSLRHIENYLALILGMQVNMCAMSGHCETNFVIESNGIVYPCDFYAADQYEVGNIMDDDFTFADQAMLNNPAVAKMMRRSLLLPEKCRKCQYYELCHNGCARERDGKSWVNVHCESLRRFFKIKGDKLRHGAVLLSKHR